MKQWLSIAICLCGLTIVNCGDSDSPTEPTNPTGALRELIAQTPRADEEAEMAALWLSGELVAPESLYIEIRDALKSVRRQYKDSITELSGVVFDHPWSEKLIIPYLDSAGITNYRAGNHLEIDSLTELLNGEVFDTTYHTWNGSFIVTIKFPGCLNIDSVGNMYLKLASVPAINHYWRFGDWPNVYPWRLADGRLTLLFRDAWGDCMAGCAYSHFWYFRIVDDDIEYVGDYLPSDETTAPDWWDEAKEGYEEFMGFR